MTIPENWIIKDWVLLPYFPCFFLSDIIFFDLFHVFLCFHVDSYKPHPQVILGMVPNLFFQKWIPTKTRGGPRPMM